MSGTPRDLLFGSKSCCFACKNCRWGLGPIETSNSDARHAVLHAENLRWVQGLIDTCTFNPKVAGLQAKTSDKDWDQYRLVIPVLKSLVLHAQNHRWGLEPIWPFYSCAKHAVMCAQNHRWGLGLIQTCKSGPKVAVLQAQKDRWGQGTTETWNSGPKCAVLNAKTTDEGWDK